MALVPRLVIEPTPKKFWVSSNKLLSLKCKTIWKFNSTWNPTLISLFLRTLIKKQPSPSINPVINQGLRFKCPALPKGVAPQP